MQPVHCSMSARVASSMSSSATTSLTAKRPPGLRTRAASRKTGGLVAGEVDDAVGDDHVDRVVGERDVLDRALEELDVLDPGLALVLPRQLEHLVGHVEAVGLAGRADPPGREQDVDPAAGAEVEDRLALVQLGDRGRVAAAEAGQLGCLGQDVAITRVVETGAEQLALFLGDPGRVAAAARRALAGGHRRLGVAIPDRVAELAGVLGTVLAPALQPQVPASCSGPQHSPLASGSQQVSCAAGEQQLELDRLLVDGL